MMDGTRFLGRDTNYWLELQRKAEILNLTDLIQEVATLRAKVSFYESRINEMSQFMHLELEVKPNEFSRSGF